PELRDSVLDFRAATRLIRRTLTITHTDTTGTPTFTTIHIPITPAHHTIRTRGVGPIAATALIITIIANELWWSLIGKRSISQPTARAQNHVRTKLPKFGRRSPPA